MNEPRKETEEILLLRRNLEKAVRGWKMAPNKDDVNVSIRLNGAVSDCIKALQDRDKKIERLSQSALSRRVELQQEKIEELRKELSETGSICSAHQTIDPECDTCNVSIKIITEEEYRDFKDLEAKLKEAEEKRVMELAGISTASIQNTVKSIKERIGKSNPYWTVAYGDVCIAIDREIYLRAKLKIVVEAGRALIKAQDKPISDFDNFNAWLGNKRDKILALDKTLKSLDHNVETKDA